MNDPASTLRRARAFAARVLRTELPDDAIVETSTHDTGAHVIERVVVQMPARILGLHIEIDFVGPSRGRT